eukprot:3835759-Pleurochrysis_carterae.AAC.1
MTGSKTPRPRARILPSVPLATHYMTWQLRTRDTRTCESSTHARIRREKRFATCAELQSAAGGRGAHSYFRWSGRACSSYEKGDRKKQKECRWRGG